MKHYHSDKFSALPSLEMASRHVDSLFEHFCPTAGIGAVEWMLREHVQQLTDTQHSRAAEAAWKHVKPQKIVLATGTETASVSSWSNSMWWGFKPMLALTC
jgi:hypothetical protein